MGGTGKAGVLILHGMGRQDEHFADTFMRDLRIVFDQRGWTYSDAVLQPVHYAGVFEDVQKKRGPGLISTSFWWQCVSRLGRWALSYILSDAVSYKSGGGYHRVQEIVSASLTELQAGLEPGAPVIIAAHSLGAMVMSDYIYDRRDKPDAPPRPDFDNLAGMVTFGCNIPLFEMGHLVTKSFTAKGEGFRWDNFFSPFDILGYRMSRYYDTGRNYALEDTRVLPGCLVFWTWFSHNGYWKSTTVQRRIVDMAMGSVEA